MSISQKLSIYSLLLLVMVLLYSCEPEDDSVVIPENQAPVIQRLSPTINKLLLPQNEILSLEFKVADREQLASFTLSLQVQNPNGTQLSNETLLEESIRGTIETVDTSLPLEAFPAFSHLVFTATVRDVEGLTDSTTYEMDILSDASQDPLFKMFTTESKSLYQEGDDSAFVMNLTTQRIWNSLEGNRLDMDIAVINNGGDNFEPVLMSPAADETGLRAVFLQTDTDTLNYVEVTHEVLFRAFSAFSGQEQARIEVRENDLILVRLTRAPAPQFAVLTIEEIIDEVGKSNDRIVFSYKVSSP